MITFKKSQVFIFLGFGIILIGAGLWTFRYSNRGTSTIAPRRSSIKEAVYAIGTVQSRSRFSFKVGISKTLEQVFAREGERVKKGDKLLRLSDSGILFSPMNGTVTSLPFYPGENIFSDSPIIIVEDLEDRYIVAKLEQQGALRVRRDLKVSLSFESIRSQVFHGTVKSIFPQNGQFIANIETEKMPPEIIPGMTADVAIEVASKENALLIPIRAVTAGGVVIIRNGKKERIPVKIGNTDQEWAEVLEPNLSIEDQVILPTAKEK